MTGQVSAAAPMRQIEVFCLFPGAHDNLLVNAASLAFAQAAIDIPGSLDLIFRNGFETL
jgi:hypothetical protein